MKDKINIIKSFFTCALFFAFACMKAEKKQAMYLTPQQVFEIYQEAKRQPEAVEDNPVQTGVDETSLQEGLDMTAAAKISGVIIKMPNRLSFECCNKRIKDPTSKDSVLRGQQFPKNLQDLTKNIINQIVSFLPEDISLSPLKNLNYSIDSATGTLKILNRKDLWAEVPLDLIESDKTVKLFGRELVTTLKTDLRHRDPNIDLSDPNPEKQYKNYYNVLITELNFVLPMADLKLNKDGVVEVSFRSTSKPIKIYVELLKHGIIDVNFSVSNQVLFKKGCRIIHEYYCIANQNLSDMICDPDKKIRNKNFCDMILKGNFRFSLEKKLEIFEEELPINIEALEYLLSSGVPYIGIFRSMLDSEVLYLALLKSCPDLLLNNLDKFFPPEEVVGLRYTRLNKIKEILEDPKTIVEQKIDQLLRRP